VYAEAGTERERERKRERDSQREKERKDTQSYNCTKIPGKELERLVSSTFEGFFFSLF
jgi:hypothetical protein